MGAAVVSRPAAVGSVPPTAVDRALPPVAGAVLRSAAVDSMPPAAVGSSLPEAVLDMSIPLSGAPPLTAVSAVRCSVDQSHVAECLGAWNIF
jgi:hypothetical protein